jgi:hypothetical protein
MREVSKDCCVWRWGVVNLDCKPLHHIAKVELATYASYGAGVFLIRGALFNQR